MTIVSVLAGSLYASLQIGFRARDKAVRAVAPVRAMALAMDLLREDIQSALPPHGILAGPLFGEDAQDDDGRDADVLEFFASSHFPDDTEPAADDARATDVRKVEIALATEDDRGVQDTSALGGDLVRRITTNLLAPTEPEPREEVLCRGVLSLNFCYFDGAEWLDSWDSGGAGNVLPVAIEVTLEALRPDASPERACRATQVFLLPCRQEAEERGAPGGAGPGG